MKTFKYINCTSINIRSIPNNQKVSLYASKILGNEIFPPIKVYKNPKGKYYLLNGRHRLTANRKLNKKQIYVEIHTGLLYKLQNFLLLLLKLDYT